MPFPLPRPLVLRAALALAFLGGASCAALAAPVAAVHDAAEQQKQAMLDTMRDLVNIESGSRDVEGVERIAALIGERLKALGGKVEILQATDISRLDDTPERVGPMVHAEFKGSGQKKIMLIAHMDTVYRNGMLKDQPFRIDGDRAYGLGIADDKHGVALILHTVALLQKLDFKDYGTLTVLINGDEEISSPGARATITRLGAEQDAVFSFEGGGAEGRLTLATSGIGAAYLTVQGKTSHAGARPEGGVNALTELSHQILQLKDLSKPEEGLKLNWTVAQAGTNRNVIPGQATAQADARALKVSDFDALERTLQERIQKKLLPEAKVSVKFEVRRPPLEATPRLARPRQSRRRHLPGTRPAYESRRPRQRRRHRRRLRRPQGPRPRHRRHGPERLRRPLQRRRIHPDPLHRPPPLPGRPHDHGRLPGQGPDEITPGAPGARPEPAGAKQTALRKQALRQQRPPSPRGCAHRKQPPRMSGQAAQGGLAGRAPANLQAPPTPSHEAQARPPPQRRPELSPPRAAAGPWRGAGACRGARDGIGRSRRRQG